MAPQPLMTPFGPRHPNISQVVPSGLLAGQPSTGPQFLLGPRPVMAIKAGDPQSGPKCDNTQERGKHPAYSGPSVSALYDQIFHPGPAIPYLDTHVPKSLRTWADWNGKGHDLILLGMYEIGHPSYLIGLDPDTEKVIGTVVIKESHLAGMGFLRDWLFTQDDAPTGPNNHHPKVRRYRIDALRAAMQRSASTGDKVFLAADGPADPIKAIDFFTVDGDSVYAGNHGGPDPGLMYRYQLNDEGHLHQVEGPWNLPPRVQGMVLTPDDFIFSSDDDMDRGKLIVIRRAAPDQTKAPVACVWVPAMPENMTVHDGQLFLNFESGTKRYEHDHPVNRITHVHKVLLSSLLAIADPVALAAETTIVAVPPPGATPKLPIPAVQVPALPLPALPLPTASVAPAPLETAAPSAAPDDAAVAMVHVSDAYISYLTALFDSYLAHIPGATVTPAPTATSIPSQVQAPASVTVPDNGSAPAPTAQPAPSPAPSAAPSVAATAAATSEVSPDAENLSDEPDASGSVRFSDAGDTRTFETSSTSR